MKHITSYCAIIDQKSNIINQSDSFREIFNVGNKAMLYDNEIFVKYKPTLLQHDKLIISNKTSSPIFLINILNKNYTLRKTPLIINKQLIGIQVTVEEFIINSFNKLLNKNIELHPSIKHEHKYITGYSSFQQEIIFCLLNNKTNYKSIANFLSKLHNNTINDTAIRDSLQAIYNKIIVTNKEHLIDCLFYLGFDNHIPKSLFPNGIYFDFYQ